jgi:hypothetical protein
MGNHSSGYSNILISRPGGTARWLWNLRPGTWGTGFKQRNGAAGRLPWRTSTEVQPYRGTCSPWEGPPQRLNANCISLLPRKAKEGPEPTGPPGAVAHGSAGARPWAKTREGGARTAHLAPPSLGPRLFDILVNLPASKTPATERHWHCLGQPLLDSARTLLDT